MYNGIGLTTTRGTGTSGHIRRNLASVPNRQRRRRVHPVNPHATLRQRLKQTSTAIQTHEQRRRIELQVMELRETLENRGVDEAEIAQRTNNLREKLVSKFEKEREKREKEKESERHVEVPPDVPRDHNPNVQGAVENHTSAFKIEHSVSHRSPTQDVEEPPPPPITAAAENANEAESNHRQRYLQHMQNLNNRRFQRTNVERRPQPEPKPSQTRPQTRLQPTSNARNHPRGPSNERRNARVHEQPRDGAATAAASGKRDMIDGGHLAKSEPVHNVVQAPTVQYPESAHGMQPTRANGQQCEKTLSNTPADSMPTQQQDLREKAQQSDDDDEEKFFYSRKSVHAYEHEHEHEHDAMEDDVPHEEVANGRGHYERNPTEAVKAVTEVKEEVEVRMATELSMVEKPVKDAVKVDEGRKEGYRRRRRRESRSLSRDRARRERTRERGYERMRSRSPSTRSASIRRARYKRGNQSPLSDEFPRRGRKNVHYERYSSDLYYSDTSSSTSSRSRSQSRDSNLSYDSGRYSRYSRSPSPASRRKRDYSRDRERLRYRSPEKVYDSRYRRRYSREHRKGYEESYYDYRYYSRSPRSDTRDDEYGYRRRSKRDEFEERDEEVGYRRKRRRSNLDYESRYGDRSISRERQETKRSRFDSARRTHDQWSRRYSYDKYRLEGRRYEY